MLLALSSWVAFVTSTVILIRLVDICIEHGTVVMLKTIAGFLVALPGVRGLVKAFTQREVKGFIKDTFDKDEKQDDSKIIEIPENGTVFLCYGGGIHYSQSEFTSFYLRIFV